MYSFETYPDLIEKLDTMSLDDALDYLDDLYNKKKIDRYLYTKACYNRLTFCAPNYDQSQIEKFH